MADIQFEDIDLANANQAGANERSATPIAETVRYDGETGRLIVDFSNGAALLIPARALQGLEDASDQELSEVELLGETGLHWEARDIDFTIAGLMQGVFGTAAFMNAQRRGGQSRSEAKTAASRANGANGGRPRKVGP